MQVLHIRRDTGQGPGVARIRLLRPGHVGQVPGVGQGLRLSEKQAQFEGLARLLQ